MSDAIGVYLEFHGVKVPFRNRWSATKRAPEDFVPSAKELTREEIKRELLIDLCEQLTEALPQTVKNLVEEWQKAGCP